MGASVPMGPLKPRAQGESHGDARDHMAHHLQTTNIAQKTAAEQGRPIGLQSGLHLRSPEDWPQSCSNWDRPRGERGGGGGGRRIGPGGRENGDRWSRTRKAKRRRIRSPPFLDPRPTSTAMTVPEILLSLSQPKPSMIRRITLVLEFKAHCTPYDTSKCPRSNHYIIRRR